MAVSKVSLKELKRMHEVLGGNAKGFYITSYSHCVYTGAQINIDNRIAKFERKNASADYYLVSGKIWKR